MIRNVEIGRVCLGEQETFEFLRDFRGLVLWSETVDRVEVLEPSEDGEDYRIRIRVRLGSMVPMTTEMVVRVEPSERRVTLYSNDRLKRFSACLTVLSSASGTHVQLETKLFFSQAFRWAGLLIGDEFFRQNRRALERLVRVCEELSALEHAGIAPTAENLLLSRRSPPASVAPRRMKVRGET